MQRVTVLGSTGSIGRQALDVVHMHPDLFTLRGLGARSSRELFLSQLENERPALAPFGTEIPVPEGTMLFAGKDGLDELASDPETDIVVLGVSGFAALSPLLCALRAGKRVALANKESIVCGGSLVKEAMREGGGVIYPVDSEQSALFQCLQNGKKEEVESLILTASGGPFYKKKREELRFVTPEQAIAHPTWSMGRKISLDSATMFNKGLEVMEAAGLFDFPAEKIEVLIHPQSIVHSMVAYRDGTVMADMAKPDMRLAIQYAMTYPDRIPSPAGKLDFTSVGELTFERPSFERFPALKMAYDCQKAGKCYPVVYNAANEAAAGMFFEGAIGFTEIESVVSYALESFSGLDGSCLDNIFAADALARESAQKYLSMRR